MDRRGSNPGGSAKGRVLIAGLVTALALVWGCSGQTLNIARPPLDTTGEADLHMVLGPGDDVEILFFYTPNLNVLQTVRRDGMISMPLLGDVQAAGLSPAQLAQKLASLYEGQLLDPEITVILRSQWARRVYVGGQVRHPGAYPIPAPMTVMQAIMESGGPREDYAELSNVLIIRQGGERRKIGSIDLSAAFGLAEPEDGGTAPVFYLKPGDIVYVPETRIVEINRWLDQHIHDPFLGAGVRASLGNVDLLYDLSGSRGAESW